MGRIVIWGLKTDLHSHKFIQNAFYTNFKKMGFETFWVDDREKIPTLLLSTTQSLQLMLRRNFYRFEKM
jgi:hypothetical protein